MIQPRLSHEVLALVIALLLHVALAAAYLWSPDDSGAQAAGLGGLSIALGPAGSAPGAAVETVSEVDTVDAVAAESVVLETPVDEIDTVTPETVKALESEPDTAVDAQEPDTLPPEDIETVEATPPDTVAAQTVETAKPVEPEPVTAKPAPPPPAPAPRSPAPAPAPAPAPSSTAPADTPAPAGNQGQAGNQATGEAGDADDRSGGGSPGAAADYAALISAWLEKHKEYPRRARQRNHEGTALLYFVIDRQGRIISHRLQRSSGHEALDREVEAMLQRAQPLPAMPADMPGDRLELVVPVQFRLR